MPHAEFEFNGCHTIGMLFQHYGERDPAVSFIAYRVTHPAERRIVLKIATHVEDVMLVLKRVASVIESACNQITTTKTCV